MLHQVIAWCECDFLIKGGFLINGGFLIKGDFFKKDDLLWFYNHHSNRKNI